MMSSDLTLGLSCGPLLFFNGGLQSLARKCADRRDTIDESPSLGIHCSFFHYMELLNKCQPASENNNFI
eukprot:1343284-Amphidinium_carterae.1